MPLRRRSIARPVVDTAIIANTATRVSNRVQRHDELDDDIPVATTTGDASPASDASERAITDSTGVDNA
jgi:hypothetical protein